MLSTWLSQKLSTAHLFRLTLVSLLRFAKSSTHSTRLLPFQQVPNMSLSLSSQRRDQAASSLETTSLVPPMSALLWKLLRPLPNSSPSGISICSIKQHLFLPSHVCACIMSSPWWLSTRLTILESSNITWRQKSVTNNEHRLKCNLHHHSTTHQQTIFTDQNLD